MVVFPVIVAFHTADWLPIAVESYLSQFPADRILVVDNNPQPGETGWSATCRRERRWLYSHPKIDVIHRHANCAGIPAQRTHGDGMDLAFDWCRSRGADVMLHIEPDCLVTGRAWRENLVGAIEEGAWMAGAHRKPWGPIHPTPSAWLVREVRTSFAIQYRPRPVAHPRFSELVNLEVLRAAAEPEGCWEIGLGTTGTPPTRPGSRPRSTIGPHWSRRLDFGIFGLVRPPTASLWNNCSSSFPSSPVGSSAPVRMLVRDAWKIVPSDATCGEIRTPRSHAASCCSN